MGTSWEATPTWVLLGTKVVLAVLGMGGAHLCLQVRAQIPSGKGLGGMESENSEERVDLFCSMLWMLQAARRHQQGEITQRSIY